MRSLMIILLAKYLDDKIEKNAMGGTCSAYGNRGEAYTGLWRKKNLGKRGNLEEPGVNGRIILRWIFRKWDGECHGLDRSVSG
jgi:hypothetical protein